MPWAGDVNHIEVVLFNEPAQVQMNKILPGDRAPLSQQHVHYIRARQWLMTSRTPLRRANHANCRNVSSGLFV